MNDSDDQRNPDLDWEKRVLCSDESCIGTIGRDGCCKECGRPYAGELPAGFFDGQEKASALSKTSPGGEAPDDSTPDAEQGGQHAGSSHIDDEWSQRTLCSDESCIGVVGKDGRCKECGLPYPGK